MTQEVKIKKGQKIKTMWGGTMVTAEVVGFDGDTILIKL